MKYYGIITKDGKFSCVHTWNECSKRTHGVSGVKFKSFTNQDEMYMWRDNIMDTYFNHSDLNGLCLYSDGGSNTYNGKPRPKGSKRNSTDLSAWAYVITNENEGLIEDSGFIQGQTNNYNELMGAYQGLLKLKQLGFQRDSITLVTDSQYLINNLNYNWNGDVPDSKPNKLLGKNLWKLYKEFSDIHVHWVKGHQTTKFNNRCDELCNMEINKKMH